VDARIAKAIDEFKGKPVEPGQVVVHVSEPRVVDFVRYEGEQAVCLLDGIEVRFPASEIFDVNKVKNRAQEIAVEERAAELGIFGKFTRLY
jgi:hypothetical protein